MPRLTDAELARVTLAHYHEGAEGFWEGTRDHDVSQNRNALLKAIPGAGPFRILDLGCGPGRDPIAFSEFGHQPIGLDGARALVEMARELAGIGVWHQDFLRLDLPDGAFDGVFANASLFHAPTQELPRVLRELRACLRPGGVLFASDPRALGEAGRPRPESDPPGPDLPAGGAGPDRFREALGGQAGLAPVPRIRRGVQPLGAH